MYAYATPTKLLSTEYTFCEGCWFMCARSFRAHFPCEFGTKDYDFCTGRLGGAIVKGPDGPRAIVHEIPGMPPAYLDFFTIRVVTPLTPAQVDRYATLDSAFFSDAHAFVCAPCRCGLTPQLLEWRRAPSHMCRSLSRRLDCSPILLPRCCATI